MQPGSQRDWGKKTLPEEGRDDEKNTPTKMQPGRQRDWDRENLPEEGRSSREEDSDEDSDSRLGQRRQEALETGIGRDWDRKAERRQEEAMKMQLCSYEARETGSYGARETGTRRDCKRKAERLGRGRGREAMQMRLERLLQEAMKMQPGSSRDRKL